MAYSYQDFLNKMNAAGLKESQFSSYDLDMAKQNPEAGIGLIDAKYRFVNAQTDAERTTANMDAEQIRSSYGNYKGGSFGTGYTPIGPSPSSFKPQETPTYTDPYGSQISSANQALQNYPSYQAPTYNNQYAGQQSQLLNDMLNYKDFTSPEYVNKYSDQQQDLLNQITGYKPFSFDADTNPQMQAYRKQYSREGQRAMQDTLGSLSAATGGMPSTAAMNAAGQANDYYMGQLNDKLPQIYESEYNKYLQDFGMLQDKFGSVNQMEGMDYSRYWDGKNFDYAKYLDDYNRMSNNLGMVNGMEGQDYNRFNTDRQFDYGQYLDKYNQTRNGLTDAMALDQNAYTKYQTDLNQSNTENNFNYGQLLDQIANNNGIYDRQRQDEQTQYDRSLDEWEKKYKFDAQTADIKQTEWNNAYDRWKGSGKADAATAQILGIKEGSVYGGEEAMLAIEQAKANIEQTNKETDYIGTKTGGTSGTDLDKINSAYTNVTSGNYSGADIAVLKDAGWTADEIAALTGGDGNDATGVDAAFSRLSMGTATADDITMLKAAGYTDEQLKEWGWTNNANGETDWREDYDEDSLRKVASILKKDYDKLTEADIDNLQKNSKYAFWNDENDGLIHIDRK